MIIFAPPAATGSPVRLNQPARKNGPAGPEPESSPPSQEIAGLSLPEVEIPLELQVAAIPCPSCRQPIGPAATHCPACGSSLWERQYWVRPPQIRIPAYVLGKPGGFGRRFLAFVIDSALLLLFFVVTWPIVSGESIIDYIDPVFSYNPAAADNGLTFGAGNLYNAARNISTTRPPLLSGSRLRGCGSAGCAWCGPTGPGSGSAGPWRATSPAGCPCFP